MLIDESRAPLMFLRSREESDVPVEQQLQRLLDQGRPFVLVMDHSPEEHHDESAQERRERALFFKRVKDQMRSVCRGMIVLEGGKPTPAPMRLAAAGLSKAFGFKVGFVDDETAAIELGLRWMLLSTATIAPDTPPASPQKRAGTD